MKINKKLLFDVTLACEDHKKNVCITSLVKMKNEDQIFCDMTLACEDKKIFCDVTLACEYQQKNDFVMWPWLVKIIQKIVK